MFGFGEQEPVPARPEALALAQAMVSLVQASQALEAAEDKVPSYTGQWSPKDYFAQEQEDFNRAADAYADAVKAVITSPLAPAIEPVCLHQEFLSQRINELPLPRRLKTAFGYNEVDFVGDLFWPTPMSFGELLRMPNLGVVSIIELIKYLHANDIVSIAPPTTAPTGYRNPVFFDVLLKSYQSAKPTIADRWVRPIKKG